MRAGRRIATRVDAGGYRSETCISGESVRGRDGGDGVHDGILGDCARSTAVPTAGRASRGDIFATAPTAPYRREDRHKKRRWPNARATWRGRRW